MKINEKTGTTDIELDYDYVMSEDEQRELLVWFKNNKPDMWREVFCDDCPEVY